MRSRSYGENILKHVLNGMFTKLILDYADNMFPSLLQSNSWELFSVSRQGANLVAVKDDSIPIVRTTTAFTKPSQPFSSVHYNIIESIKNVDASKHLRFNNAMAEIYTPEYTKMRFHSDQALDLAPDSPICVFSCYETEFEPNPRRLVIKHKTSGETSQIDMNHNSAILFSKSINEQYLHKIVSGPQPVTSTWLGITFRLSKTFVKYVDEIPHLVSSNKVLTLADEQERKDFFKHKSLENAQIGYDYPDITYTLSRVI